MCNVVSGVVLFMQKINTIYFSTRFGEVINQVPFPIAPSLIFFEILPEIAARFGIDPQNLVVATIGGNTLTPSDLNKTIEAIVKKYGNQFELINGGTPEPSSPPDFWQPDMPTPDDSISDDVKTDMIAELEKEFKEWAQPDDPEWKSARQRYLLQLEIVLKSDPKINEKVVSLEKILPIPLYKGKPLAKTGEITAVAERLIKANLLQGTVWKGIFFGDSATAQVIKKCANVYPSITLTDLAEKFENIEIGALKRLVSRLLEEKKIVADFDREKGVLILQRKIDEIAIKRLNGMIRINKRIDLNKAAEILRVPKESVETLIYELAGDGKIEGEFDEKADIFTIKSDVGGFINELNRQFQEWDKKTPSKDGKV